MTRSRSKSGLLRRAAAGGTRYAINALSSFAGWLSAYPSTDPASKLFGFGRPRTGGSGDMALAGNLTTLAAQGRHIERGTCMGRAVTEAWKADFVGRGIDVSPKSGDPSLDARLKEVWALWAERACVDGMPLWEWQALMVGQLPPAGAALTRLVVLPQRIQSGVIPMALLPLEIEWLTEMPVAEVAQGHKFVRGVEVDGFGVPQFYHLRNPENINAGPGERVSANQIIHVFERRRAQQSHGEPALAPAIGRIMQDDRLVLTELDASVNTSALAVAITSERALDEGDDPDDPVTDIQPGTVVRLHPGENVETIANSRPSQLIDPFRGTLRGDVAGALRVNRQHLDRDYQRSTFMNSRMSNQDTDRLQASLKSLLCRQLAGSVYEAAFPWLMLAVGQTMPSNPIRRAQLMRYAVRPDERPYVDPTKDIAAAANAIALNLSTYHIEAAGRGKDFDEILAERKAENEALLAAGLPLPSVIKPSAQPLADDAADADDLEDVTA